MGNFSVVAAWITETERPVSNYWASSSLFQLNKVGGAQGKAERWQGSGRQSLVWKKRRGVSQTYQSKRCEHLCERGSIRHFKGIPAGRGKASPIQGLLNRYGAISCGHQKSFSRRWWDQTLQTEGFNWWKGCMCPLLYPKWWLWKRIEQVFHPST